MEDVLLVYLAVLNLVTFALYGADKRRAKKGQWRIPEKTLLILPLLGGSVGGILGMAVFHHKTRHWYFRWGLPAMFLLQAAGAVYLLARYRDKTIENKKHLPGGRCFLCFVGGAGATARVASTQKSRSAYKRVVEDADPYEKQGWR